MILPVPGVYRPQADTRLLVQALLDAPLRPGERVLDAFTGSGAVAIRAAAAGAGHVTAVDISRRAAVSARLNAYLHRRRVQVVRRDITEFARGKRFDVVVANPPYVPSPGAPPTTGPERAWDGGPDGRVLLDRFCRALPDLLDHQGYGLIVHSEVCGSESTVRMLREGGLKAAVVVRQRIAFGPVMNARARWLESAGLVEPGQQHEEVVVIRADRTRP
ncbi:HemK2/MTQ2 family protein methyltransferase [Nocardia alni]|uniref:HemK2/MTQ2 family protein methyltransferase n=1 Tax=Nocardia alni TaxID=2815723 RepID=UPI001C249A7A|nr:HemK2/MTQ2 family protein methyltransferase [Nocardia alni]